MNPAIANGPDTLLHLGTTDSSTSERAKSLYYDEQFPLPDHYLSYDELGEIIIFAPEVRSKDVP